MKTPVGVLPYRLVLKKTRMVWLPDGEKKFEDMFNRLSHYTMANSTRSTLSKVDKVDLVALAPYTCDKVERAFDIRVTKIAYFRQSGPS